MKKACSYSRVSTVKQTEGESPELQEIAIKNYCKQNKLELTQIYFDGGVRGALKDSPSLNQ